MIRHRVIPDIVLGALLAAVSLASFLQTARSQTARKAAPDEQAVVYRNARFGFHYKIPYGWVDRTKDMGEPADAAEANSSSSNPKAAKHKAESSNEVLLAVFERPPEAAGESVNSGVVIARESAATYPGVKKAEDFVEPLGEAATAQGFKAEGDPAVVEIDGRELARADFTKAITDKLALHQTTLALVAKGQVVTFTFVAASGDEIEELIENLGFRKR